MKKFIFGINNILAKSLVVMAFMVASLSANSACFWMYHQDELPEQAKKLRKF